MNNEVDILVNNKPIKQYAHDGKIFVEAKEGAEYSIRVRNNTNSRLLAVASVDSINVISGEIADDDGAGYIINGRSSYEIKGFRTSNDNVNAFAFSRKDKSYAAKSDATDGDTQDCGVLGIKLFSEKIKKPTVVYRDRVKIVEVEKHDRWPKVDPWPYRPNRPYFGDPIWNDGGSTGGWSSASATCNNVTAKGLDNSVMRSPSDDGVKMSANMLFSASTDEGEFDMGTSFTEKEVEDKVTSTTFEKDYMCSFIEIYYASKEQLIKMGVPITKKAEISFPSSFKSTGYCRKPRK